MKNYYLKKRAIAFVSLKSKPFKYSFAIFVIFFFSCATSIDKSDAFPYPHFVSYSNHNKGQDELFIESEMREFLTKYKIAGASLAIAKDGRLAFLQSFGYANVKTGEHVTPDHLFRIASISKPITSFTILKLAEEGKLSLDTLVFGKGGVLQDKFSFSDSRVGKITIRQLLNHTSGGWGNDENDPMFRYVNLNQEQLISKILNNTSLEYEPGTHFSYSNFGYCILGRVIEKITGTSYEDYVSSNILQPIGIVNMHIAGNSQEDKLPLEVNYYSQEETSPYSMKVRRMDSHGGWVASARELLRLITMLDPSNANQNFLSSSSISEMAQPSQVNKGYALGWQVNSLGNIWHTGCLPGTATIVVHTSNGLSWVLLLNSRSLTPGFFNAMDDEMWKIVKNIHEWPSYDLFQDSPQITYLQ